MTALQAIGEGAGARKAVLLARCRTWSRLLGGFVTTSALGQAAGMLAGLIYVRLLPVDDYAFYALCLVTLSFVGVASDLGITGSATYFWRKARREGLSFAGYLAPIRRLRLWLLLAAGAVAAIALPRIAIGHGAGAFQAIAGLAVVVLTAKLAASHVVNQQVLRLSGRFAQVYVGDLAGQGTRLLAAVALYAGAIADALWALAGGMAGALAALLFSRTRVRRAMQAAPAGAAPDRPGRDVLRYVLPVAPGVTVFALQDTVVLWLAAAWGGAGVVAGVYALGRIGAILGIAGGFVLGVIVPRLAANSDDRRLGQAAWGLRASLLAGLLVAMAIAVLFPHVPLWLIGRNYAGLEAEVPVVVAIAGLNLMASTSGSLNRARGWVRLEGPLALVHGAVVGSLALTWSYASAYDVLLLMTAVSASHYLLHLSTSLVGAFRPQWVQL